MSIRIGGIDLTDAVINAEFRISVLEIIIERLAQAAPPGTITNDFIKDAREKTLSDMQKKYPDAGLSTHADLENG